MLQFAGHDLAIPKGATILVTGITGYLGSHVADQILASGYRVRGLVRSKQRAQWLKDVFGERYGQGQIELIEITSYIHNGALNEAVQGVSGIVHVATVMPMSAQPDPYVYDVKVLTLSVLSAAAREPSVRRVVITSSSMAAASPAPNIKRNITVDTWNEEIVKDAWEKPDMWNVYGASKTVAEMEAWKWMAQKPHFVLNSVLPNTNFGPAISRKHQGWGSTDAMLKSLYDGETEDAFSDPPQYFIDVRDTARLHVIGLLASTVKNERIFAFAEPYNWNAVLGILQELFPERKFPKLPAFGVDLSQYPSSRAKELLEAFGQPAWISLADSIRDTMIEE